MPIFTFTVVAVGEDLQSNENLKTLLDLGCGDATIGRVDDLQYLNFTREAESFGNAVLSAVDAVESVQGVNVINVSTDGSVKRPQLRLDHVQAALEGLITFRLHAAGLTAGIQESLLTISQRPTQGVRNWLKHVSHSLAIPTPVPTATAPSSATHRAVPLSHAPLAPTATPLPAVPAVVVATAPTVASALPSDPSPVAAVPTPDTPEWLEPSPVPPLLPPVVPPATAIDHEPQEQQRHDTPIVVQVAPDDNPTFGGARQGGKPKRQGTCQGKVVSVCANKGGVGKSTVALWLAESMHSTGSKTCLVDANLAHPHLLKMTGHTNVNPQKAVVTIPGFMDIIPGSPDPIAEDVTTLTTLQNTIQSLRTDYDWIIVDYSAANGRKLSMSKVLAPTSDAVVVVLTPDCITVDNTSQLVYDMVKPLERSGLGMTKDQLIGVFNMSSDDSGMAVADLEERIPSLNIQGTIPRIKDQIKHSNDGLWQCPSLAKEAVTRITNRLVTGADLRTVTQRQAKGSLLSRLFRGRKH